MTIVVAGEALIDVIAGPEADLSPRPGGGPFNTARALARLGAPCAYLGTLSTDRFGRMLRDALLADGVDLRWVVISERPTTLALAELDEDGAAAYRFYCDATAAAALHAEHARSLRARLHSAPALHVGSLSLGLEPAGAAIETAVAMAGPDTLVMLDPNWRPAAVAAPDAWRARLGRLNARADVVKASREDLAALAPGMGVIEAARGLLERGVRCVLVTAGACDVLIVTPSGVEHVSPPPVQVTDTIGAGDAFGAGFLAHWTARGFARDELGDPEQLAPAVRYAARVAAATCTRVGADPPRADELDAASRCEQAPAGRVSAMS